MHSASFLRTLCQKALTSHCDNLSEFKSSRMFHTCHFPIFTPNPPPTLLSPPFLPAAHPDWKYADKMSAICQMSLA